MQKIKSISFKEFLSLFPVIELPVVISKDTIIDFSRENVAFPDVALEEYIYKWDKDVDEYVEFIPCFSFGLENDMTALVYYKASLLKYEYFIVTLTKNAEIISRKIIAGMISDGDKTVQSAATITDEFSIHISGGLSVSNQLFDPKDSKQSYMEIMADGKVISINDETQ